MKKFQFGLQQVMEWRDRRAEQERSELERMHAARNRLEREREQLAEEIANSQAACAVQGNSSADDLRHLAGFLDALRAREGRVSQRVAQCRAEIGEQTGRCVKADRDHQLLVRLRDRQFTHWKYDVNRETEASASESWMAGRIRENGRSRRDGPC